MALVLLASTCSGGSDSVELGALREEVGTLKAQVAAATQDSEWELEAWREEVATLKAQVAAATQYSEWPDEYQALWVDICQPIVKALTDSADVEGLSPRGICQCTLDGLMKAFSLKDYESWTQDIKDRAAAPYVTMCWGTG